MTVTVVSRNPPGGRCTLYARYAEALSGHCGLTVDIHCPGDAPDDGIPPPALVICGKLVAPGDGVIVSPDDIAQTLGEIGLDVDLAACGAELEAIQDQFMEEMSRA